MTDFTAKAIIDAIQREKEEATKSKASALQFLKESGLIQDKKPTEKDKSISKRSNNWHTINHLK